VTRPAIGRLRARTEPLLNVVRGALEPGHPACATGSTRARGAGERPVLTSAFRPAQASLLARSSSFRSLDCGSPSLRLAGGEGGLYLQARDSVFQSASGASNPNRRTAPLLARRKECVLFEPQTIDQPAVGHANVVVRHRVINWHVGNQDTTFRNAHR
jgi:hypothetical protein